MVSSLNLFWLFFAKLLTYWWQHISAMAVTLRKCEGKETKACNYYLLSIAKDSHEMCTVCGNSSS